MKNNIKIAPSILAADFAHLEREIALAEKGGADCLHLDVMDGRFVPNITFGPIIVEAVNRLTDLPLDVHLMIVEPEKYLEGFRKSGADWITIHYETVEDIESTLKIIKSLGAGAGVSLKPGTPPSVLEKFIALLDLVLVMSVEPGFGGQSFIPGSLEKIAEIVRFKKKIGSELLISVDGGVSEANAAQIVAAGADLLVAGSSIYKSSDPVEALKRLRAAAEGK